MTNSLASDSLQNFRNLKLLRAGQSNTNTNAGISNISLMKIKFRKMGYNVKIQKKCDEVNSWGFLACL